MVETLLVEMVTTSINTKANNGVTKSIHRRKRKAPLNSTKSSNSEDPTSSVASRNGTGSTAAAAAAAAADANANIIQGVPSDLSPLLIQAIKFQKKLILNIVKHYQKQKNENNIQDIAYSLAATTDANASRNNKSNTHNTDNAVRNSTPTSNSRSIQDDILNRMEVQETNARQKQMMDDIPTGIKTQHELATQYMHEFLDRLKLEERKETKKTKYRLRYNGMVHNDNNDGAEGELDQETLQDKSPCTSVSCLIFIFDLVRDEDAKLTLRYAAILTALKVVEHTIHVRECQLLFILSSTSNKNCINNQCYYPMKKVIDSIETNNDGDIHHHRQRQHQSSHKDKCVKNQILLALYNIYNYILKNPRRDKYYDPKMIITMRYLEERKGVIIQKHPGSTNSNKNNASKNSLNQLMMSLYNNYEGCNIKNASSFVMPFGGPSMVEKRRIRDIAIKYCAREITRVDAILKCMNECMEIIVPRFAKNDETPKMDGITPAGNNLDSRKNCSEKIANVSDHCETNEHINDDDDDDDDIDWEEGDDENFLLTSNNKDVHQVTNQCTEKNEQDHQVAVENTLAMMKETGALNQEGNLQVTIDLSLTGLEQIDNVDDRRKMEARKKVTRCVNLLVDRHQPRLKSWLSALIAADNMTSALHDNNDTLSKNMNVVLLPESTRKKKQEVFQAIREVNNQVSTALALTMKLGIQSRKESLDSSLRSNFMRNNVNDYQSNPTQETSEVQDSSNTDNVAWCRVLGIQSNEQKIRKLALPKKREKLRGKVMIKLRDR